MSKGHSIYRFYTRDIVIEVPRLTGVPFGQSRSLADMDLKFLPLMLLACSLGSFVHCQNDDYDDKEDSDEIGSGTGTGTGSVKTGNFSHFYNDP